MKFRPAILSYYFIFPVFVVLQIALISGYTGIELPGGVTFLAAACLPLLLLSSYLQVIHGNNITGISVWLPFFTFLLVLGWYTLNNWQTAHEAVIKSHVSGIVQLLALYHVGKQWPMEIPHRQRQLAGVALLLMCVFVIFNAGNIKALKFQDYIIQQFNYQGVALGILATALLSIPLMSRRWRRISYAVTLAAMFFIGARSELLAFIASIFLIEYFMTGATAKGLFKAGLLWFLLLGVVSFFLSTWMPDSRIWGLLNITTDESFIDRGQLMPATLNIIQKNFWTGSYGDYNPGYYAHNIISAWVDTGFLGFYLICMVLLRCLYLSIPARNKNVTNHVYISAACCTVSAVILLAFAKYFTYPVWGLAAGLMVRNLENQKFFWR